MNASVTATLTKTSAIATPAPGNVTAKTTRLAHTVTSVWKATMVIQGE